MWTINIIDKIRLEYDIIKWNGKFYKINSHLYLSVEELSFPWGVGLTDSTSQYLLYVENTVQTLCSFFPQHVLKNNQQKNEKYNIQ